MSLHRVTRSVQHTEQPGQTTATSGGLLLFWRNRSRSGWFRGGCHGRSGRSIAIRASVGAVAGRRAATVAAALDHVVAAQLESLFGLTNHTLVAITQRTGQSGDDFGAAAAVLANLIANFIGRFTTDAFVSIVQGVDKGGHDFRVADAVIPVAKLADRSTTLTSVASGLRGVDQLSDLAGVGIAALGIAAASRRGGTGWGTGRGTRGLAVLAEETVKSLEAALGTTARGRAAVRGGGSSTGWGTGGSGSCTSWSTTWTTVRGKSRTSRSTCRAAVGSGSGTTWSTAGATVRGGSRTSWGTSWTAVRGRSRTSRGTVGGGSRTSWSTGRSAVGSGSCTGRSTTTVTTVIRWRTATGRSTAAIAAGRLDV